MLSRIAFRPPTLVRAIGSVEPAVIASSLMHATRVAEWMTASIKAFQAVKKLLPADDDAQVIEMC